jgi:hypothetical protein
LQHDHGYANGVNGALANATSPTDTEWYGVNSHLTYDVKDNLTAGVRAEWFRDQNGFRVALHSCSCRYQWRRNSYPWRSGYNSTCNAASYWTHCGENWKPKKWLNVRPNVRYDWVDGTVVGSGDHYRPFGNSKLDQFLFSTDFSQFLIQYGGLLVGESVLQVVLNS